MRVFLILAAALLAPSCARTVADVCGTDQPRVPARALFSNPVPEPYTVTVTPLDEAVELAVDDEGRVLPDRGDRSVEPFSAECTGGELRDVASPDEVRGRCDAQAFDVPAVMQLHMTVVKSGVTLFDEARGMTFAQPAAGEGPCALEGEVFVENP